MGMIKQLEDRYPEGFDLTIMNTFYQYPYKDESTGKYKDDFLVIVYKINSTGKKDYIVIKKPTYIYYKLKDEFPVPDYNMLFIEKEKVNPIEVPYTLLEKSIAEETGNEDFYKTNIANRDRARNQLLHTLPQIFFSDSSIENHYRFRFAQTYKNDIRKITKGFFDIEVDGKYSSTDFVEPTECPINCVSFMDESADQVYTFILRDKRNPLIQQFEDKVKSGKFGFDLIHNFVIDKVGGEKRANKFQLLNTKFSLLFYDYEIDLLRDLFATIHKSDVDFCEGWNSSAFDIDYIINRINALGYDPVDIMCDNSWPIKVVKNHIDRFNLNELAERGDYTFISGNTLFIDQMIQYASRRKSKIGSYSSFSLDSIGELEAGVHKLNYSHITNSVIELPWLDFETFVLYNIMDVVVQKCIEKTTNDLEYIFSKCVVNNTTYNKGHRQTVYLVNRMANDWYKKGLIIGNNANKNNPPPPKFLGALVHDPLKTGDYCKIKIDGRSIMVIDNSQDYDYKSLYPSIIGELNIASNTQVGKIEIPHKVYNRENTYKEENYSRSGEFIENMVVDNTIEFCERWFHLAGIKELIADIDELTEKTKHEKYSSFIIDPNNKSIRDIFLADKTVHSPIIENQSAHKPIIFYDKKPEDTSYNSLIEASKRIGQ